MDDALLRKGNEIFSLCDREGKGYLTQSDLESVGKELQLPGEQLAGVFERLDEDGDGKLTYDEFIMGFAEHFGCESKEENEDNFDDLMETLGARNLFKDEEMVRALWNHLHRENESEVIVQFEDFLAKMASEMKRNQYETNNLQTMLQMKMTAYEEQMRDMYEEMESQIGAEKDQAKFDVKQTEKRVGDDLRAKLEEKELLVEEMERKQSELEKKLQLVNSAAMHSKQNKSSLMKEKESLQKQLVSSQQAISELQSSLNVIRERNRDERRRRAKAALKVSESIALEREELVKQLDLLKMINQQLRDEHDERVSPSPRTSSPTLEYDPPTETQVPRVAKEKRGSVMSDYIQPKLNSSQWSQIEATNEENSETFQINGVAEPTATKPEVVIPKLTMTPPSLQTTNTGTVGFMQSIYSESEDEVPDHQSSVDEAELWNLGTSSTSLPTMTSQDTVISKPNVTTPKVKKAADPQRLFKVVFIGDSGVGKSSFIHRVCNKGFRSTFSATIGVDFHTHRVECNDQTVVLQLWDTAGQERFRSITNQYMRKADGVVIMYDVASENSFKNVRGWLGCVRDFTGVHTQILLIGNKMDLCSSTSIRAVQTSDGRRLAEENCGLFFETSVKMNTGVSESIHALACNLQETEDLEIEMALQLHMQNKTKKRCCL